LSTFSVIVLPLTSNVSVAGIHDGGGLTSVEAELRTKTAEAFAAGAPAASTAATVNPNRK
jgi:hypothetical protein